MFRDSYVNAARHLVFGCTMIAIFAGPRHAAEDDDISWPALVSAFRDQIDAYVDVHWRCAQELRLKGAGHAADGGTADRHALADCVRQARRHARPGEIFSPAIAARILQLVRTDLAARPRIDREAIVEEVPRVLVLRINDSYPAAEPIATVPAALLQRLPPLPPELQYRFLDRALVILDVDAALIVDVIPGVLRRHW